MTTTENINDLERIRSRLAILDAFVSRYDVGYNQVELVGGDDGVLYVRWTVDMGVAAIIINGNEQEALGYRDKPAYRTFRVWENVESGSGIYSFTEETRE